MVTIANHELIRLVKFVSWISTHLSKKIINRLTPENKYHLIIQQHGGFGPGNWP